MFMYLIRRLAIFAIAAGVVGAAASLVLERDEEV